MKPGPVPENPDSKELRGNPGKRSNESKPVCADPREPDCPEWLDDEAKAKWVEIVEHLAYIGLLARIDGAAIAQYCDAYSRWVQCSRWLGKNGITYESQKDRSGAVMFRLHPQVSEARQLVGLMLRLGNDMGMTPASRHRMSAVPPSEHGDEFDRYQKEHANGFDDAVVPGTTAWKEAQEARA